jgi:hypothetical protein
VKKMTLADIVAALSQMKIDEFPNAAAARGACELIQAVKDAPELDRLQAMRLKVETDMKREKP